MTRHITERQDFAVNRVFIAVFVYKNGGNKVYYPNEIKPIQDAVKTNSAHYLVKLVTEDADSHGPTFYTLVVSQNQTEIIDRPLLFGHLDLSIRKKHGY